MFFERVCDAQVDWENALNLCAAYSLKQVAQWATIAHLGASIMFGDTIIDDAQRQVTLNLKQ